MLSDNSSARRGLIRLAPLILQPIAVAGYMGLPSVTASGHTGERAINAAIALVEQAAKPIAVWGLPKLLSTSATSITVAYPTQPPVEIPANGRFFVEASSVLFMLITLGEQIDQLLANLYNEDDMLLAMACDAAAAAAMSAAGTQCRQSCQRALARRGLQMGTPYSPGCQVFPLTVQQQIFTLLSPTTIGVSLSKECLMHPAKSVTNVAPVAANLPAWMQQLDPCKLCSLRRSCTYKMVRG